MDVLEELKREVDEANKILLKNKKEKDFEIQIERNITAMNCKAKADEIISRIPKLVKEYMLEPNKNQRKYYWGIKICDLDINEDLTNHECGRADPRPGSFAEYLYNRLTELGFVPYCNWNTFNELPIPGIWPFKKLKEWAFMTISVNHLPVPLDT